MLGLNRIQHGDGVTSTSVLLNDAEDISAFIESATGMQPGYFQISAGRANLYYRSIDLDGLVVLHAHNQARARLWDQMAA